MQAAVFLRAEPTNPIRGLIITARVARPLSGMRRHLPSSALQWRGVRIRGLDYELRHDNPDGSTVRGWHEHVWSPEEGDNRVRSAVPVPNNLSLAGLFKWGLKRWNIEVDEEQFETPR